MTLKPRIRRICPGLWRVTLPHTVMPCYSWIHAMIVVCRYYGVNNFMRYE